MILELLKFEIFLIVFMFKCYLNSLIALKNGWSFLSTFSSGYILKLQLNLQKTNYKLFTRNYNYKELTENIRYVKVTWCYRIQGTCLIWSQVSG